MMNVEDWIKLFRHRHLFVDVARARTENWPVKSYILTPYQLGSLALPWRCDDKDPSKSSDWTKDDSRLLRVCEVVENLHSRGEDCRNKILELALKFSAKNEPSPLVFPSVSYSTPQVTHRMLLDGCHRACALYLISKEPKAVLLDLETPEYGSWDLSVGIGRERKNNGADSTHATN